MENTNPKVDGEILRPYFFQDAEITVFTEKFSPETTGDGAAGLWLPSVDPDTPKEKVM